MTNKLISLVIIAFFLLTGHSYSEEKFLFPKEKPSIFKKIDKKTDQKYSKNLPQKKPVFKEEKENQKNESTTRKKDVENKTLKETVKIDKLILSFIFPQKKPAIYRSTTQTAEKSSILNQKDFLKAKETIQFIKDKKWNSALKSASKVKDKEFRNLITWMHLKTTRNGASFNEYKKFIEQIISYNFF